MGIWDKGKKIYEDVEGYLNVGEAAYKNKLEKDSRAPGPSQAWGEADLNEAKKIIEAEAGRDVTPQEWEWLTSGRASQHDIGRVSPQDAARGHAANIRKEMAFIRQSASAAQIQLSDAEIRGLQKEFHIVGQESPNFESFISERLGSIKEGRTKAEFDSKYGGGGAASGPPPITGQQRETAGRLIQEGLGRAASQDEIEFFGAQLAAGESPYEVSQFLVTTPEYQRIQSEKENARVKAEELEARTALDTALQKSQQAVFKTTGENIQAQYQRAGQVNSSGLSNALVQAQKDLDEKRQGFLANAGYDAAIRAQGYGREDFVNQQATAFGQYLRQNEPAYQQRFNVQDAQNRMNFDYPFQQLAQGNAYSADRVNRLREIQDYERQGSDYYTALSNYNNQNGKNAQLQGAFGGAQAGASAGSAAGPWGALFGAVLGGAGGYASSRQRNTGQRRL